jgi:hypothetical protein
MVQLASMRLWLRAYESTAWWDCRGTVGAGGRFGAPAWPGRAAVGGIARQIRSIVVRSGQKMGDLRALLVLRRPEGKRGILSDCTRKAADDRAGGTFGVPDEGRLGTLNGATVPDSHGMERAGTFRATRAERGP